MRALLQRVTDASVKVENEIIGRIGSGLLILVCAMPQDTEATADALALKISKLRLFKDEMGKMNLSLAQTGGSALVPVFHTRPNPTTPARFTNICQPPLQNWTSRHRPANSVPTCPLPSPTMAPSQSGSTQRPRSAAAFFLALNILGAWGQSPQLDLTEGKAPNWI